MTHRSIVFSAAILLGGFWLTLSTTALAQQKGPPPGAAGQNPGPKAQRPVSELTGPDNGDRGGVGSLPKPTTVPAPVDIQRIQADALAMKLDVDYRRAFLVEILADLYKRAGLFAAWPTSINKTFSVSLTAKGLAVKEVLDKVAEQAKLKVDYLPEFVVIVQPADPAMLDKLRQKLKDPDRWVRCSAAFDLAALGDKQVAGILVGMLGDGDAGVVEWAEAGLLQHVNLIRFLSDEQKSALADAVIGQLQPLAGEAKGRPNWSLMMDLPSRMMLLAATGRPQARQAIAAWAKGAANHEVRMHAVANLVLSGQADAVRMLIALYNEAQKAEDDYQADVQKNGQKPWEGAGVHPLVASGDCKRIAMLTLQRANAAESLAFITEYGVWPLPVRATFGPVQRWFPASGLGDVGVLSATSPHLVRQAKQTLADALGKAPEAEPAPADGAEPAWSPYPHAPITPFGTKISDALDALANAGNADAVDLIVKVIGDGPAMSAVAPAADLKAGQAAASLRATGVDQLGGCILATDPAIVAALLARFPHAGDQLKLYILRSLGTSHDPRAADFLMQLLTDPDARLRARAATALAQTRDSRATDALLACLKMPAAKLPWPDWEQEAQDRKRKGQPSGFALNARNEVAVAVAATRDPKATELMLAAGADQGLEAEASEAAMMYVCNAPITDADLDLLAAGLAKLDAARQRLALLPVWSGGWSWRSFEARCLADGRIVAIIADRVHDPEAFVAQGGAFRDNAAILRLQRPPNPRSERALLDLTKDADEYVSFFAARGLKQFGDPQVEVKLQR